MPLRTRPTAHAGVYSPRPNHGPKTAQARKEDRPNPHNQHPHTQYQLRPTTCSTPGQQQRKPSGAQGPGIRAVVGARATRSKAAHHLPSHDGGHTPGQALWPVQARGAWIDQSKRVPGPGITRPTFIPNTRPARREGIVPVRKHSWQPKCTPLPPRRHERGDPTAPLHPANHTQQVASPPPGPTP